jgi:hypothetical protein
MSTKPSKAKHRLLVALTAAFTFVMAPVRAVANPTCYSLTCDISGPTLSVTFQGYTGTPRCFKFNIFKNGATGACGTVSMCTPPCPSSCGSFSSCTVQVTIPVGCAATSGDNFVVEVEDCLDSTKKCTTPSATC